MNVQPTREGGQWSESRRLVLAFLLLASVVGGVVAARGANATVVVGESAIVSAVRLLAHGIELKAVPFTEKAPAISAESAQATARKVIDAAKDPDETFQVLASATYDAPKQTAWLLLFAGGSEEMSGGPPEGAESRTIIVDFTGVLVDDQTGEVLRWFRGGTVVKS